MGLGLVILTWRLGSKDGMTFGPKPKYYSGKLTVPKKKKKKKKKKEKDDDKPDESDDGK